MASSSLDITTSRKDWSILRYLRSSTLSLLFLLRRPPFPPPFSTLPSSLLQHSPLPPPVLSCDLFSRSYVTPQASPPPLIDSLEHYSWPSSLQLTSACAMMNMICTVSNYFSTPSPPSTPSRRGIWTVVTTIDVMIGGHVLPTADSQLTAAEGIDIWKM
jgi:hypothetical protein